MRNPLRHIERRLEDRPIRVMLIEDDPEAREGLAALIATAPGYRCVAQYGSVDEAVARYAGEEPNVALVDIHLPGTSGVDGVRVLKEVMPRAEVVMLTVFAEDEKVLESICNGAVGYLLKKTPAPRLLDAIREAAGGGAPMSPEIARKVVSLLRSAPVRAASTNEQLTPQEVRLLQALADGHSYQAAAEQLGITINTIRTYVRAVYAKLHVHSKSGAVSKALRRGLIR